MHLGSRDKCHGVGGLHTAEMIPPAVLESGSSRSRWRQTRCLVGASCPGARPFPVAPQGGRDRMLCGVLFQGRSSHRDPSTSARPSGDARRCLRGRRSLCSLPPPSLRSAVGPRARAAHLLWIPPAPSTLPARGTGVSPASLGGSQSPACGTPWLTRWRQSAGSRVEPRGALHLWLPLSRSCSAGGGARCSSVSGTLLSHPLQSQGGLEDGQ